MESKLVVQLRPGYHCNSNTPSDEYLIPLRLSWGSGAIAAAGIAYPLPKTEKYEFSAKPLSVYSGAFEIVTRFKAGADAPLGAGKLTGKLRYQACTDRLCLPPRSIEVTLPFEVVQ